LYLELCSYLAPQLGESRVYSSVEERNKLHSPDLND